MPLGTRLGRGDVKLMAYPERGVPKGAILEAKDAVDHALLFPITTNEPLVASKLSSMTGAEGISATIEPGFRAVSVAITDVSGVAGLIQPNSRVDVLFTRTGTLAEASTTTILQNVKVLSTGHTQASGQTADARAPRSPVVILVLPPADAQKLELAKNQGRIGLSLRNPATTRRPQAPGR
jgi:pilus assembly protein CpaB